MRENLIGGGRGDSKSKEIILQKFVAEYKTNTNAYQNTFLLYPAILQATVISNKLN